MIKGKTPEEIRKTFNIKNDFTPEEEEEVRRENQWAFEWKDLKWPICNCVFSFLFCLLFVVGVDSNVFSWLKHQTIIVLMSYHPNLLCIINCEVILDLVSDVNMVYVLPYPLVCFLMLNDCHLACWLHNLDMLLQCSCWLKRDQIMCSCCSF